MIFIFNWVISRFHVNFQWCSNSWHAISGCSSKRGVQVCVCVMQNDENLIGYYLWIINDHDSETAFCWSHEDHPISFQQRSVSTLLIQKGWEKNCPWATIWSMAPWH